MYEMEINIRNGNEKRVKILVIETINMNEKLFFKKKNENNECS